MQAYRPVALYESFPTTAAAAKQRRRISRSLERPKYKDGRRNFRSRKKSMSPPQKAMYHLKANGSGEIVTSSPPPPSSQRQMDTATRLAVHASPYDDFMVCRDVDPERKRIEKEQKKLRKQEKERQKKLQMLMFSDGWDSASANSGLSAQELIKKKKKDEMKRKKIYGRPRTTIFGVPQIIRSGSPRRKLHKSPQGGRPNVTTSTSTPNTSSRLGFSPSRHYDIEHLPTDRGRLWRIRRPFSKGGNIDITPPSPPVQVRTLKGDSSASTTQSSQYSEHEIDNLARQRSVRFSQGIATHLDDDEEQPQGPDSVASESTPPSRHDHNDKVNVHYVHDPTASDHPKLQKKPTSSKQKYTKSRKKEESQKGSPTSVMEEQQQSSMSSLRRKQPDPIAQYRRSHSFQENPNAKDAPGPYLRSSPVSSDTDGTLLKRLYPTAITPNKKLPKKGERVVPRYYTNDVVNESKRKRSQKQTSSPSRGSQEQQDTEQVKTTLPLSSKEVAPPFKFTNSQGIELSPIRPGDKDLNSSRSSSQQESNTSSKHAWRFGPNDTTSFDIPDDEFAHGIQGAEQNPEFVALVAAIVIQTAVRRFLAIRTFEQMVLSYFHEMGATVTGEGVIFPKKKSSVSPDAPKREDDEQEQQPQKQNREILHTVQINQKQLKSSESSRPDAQRSKGQLLQSPNHLPNKGKESTMRSMDPETTSKKLLQRSPAHNDKKRSSKSIGNAPHSIGPENGSESRMDFMWNLAAVRIQAAFRGWWIRDSLYVDHYCATLMQKVVRGHLARIGYHVNLYRVILIQASLRKFIAKCRARQRLGHIVAVQAMVRGFLSRRAIRTLNPISPPTVYRQHQRGFELNLSFKMRSAAEAYRQRMMQISEAERQLALAQIVAAIMIQTRWRSWWTRHLYLNFLADLLIIQSVARRWMTQRQLRKRQDMQRMGRDSKMTHRLMENKSRLISRAKSDVFRRWRQKAAGHGTAYPDSPHQQFVNNPPSPISNTSNNSRERQVRVRQQERYLPPLRSTRSPSPTRGSTLLRRREWPQEERNHQQMRRQPKDAPGWNSRREASPRYSPQSTISSSTNSSKRVMYGTPGRRGVVLNSPVHSRGSAVSLAEERRRANKKKASPAVAAVWQQRIGEADGNPIPPHGRLF